MSEDQIQAIAVAVAKHLEANSLGEMKADIRGLKADVGTLKADVGTLKADVGTLKADVGTLKAAVGNLDRKFDDLNAKVNQHYQEFREFQTAMDGRI